MNTGIELAVLPGVRGRQVRNTVFILLKCCLFALRVRIDETVTLFLQHAVRLCCRPPNACFTAVTSG